VSRSSPSAPLYLQGAITRVERLLAEHYPEPRTVRQIVEELVEEGYRWPLPDGYYRSRGRTVARSSDYGDPTPERVRRVCELKHNRTVIAMHDNRERPRRYTIYSWAIQPLLARLRAGEHV
jgi:hypothetical protein